MIKYEWMKWTRVAYPKKLGEKAKMKKKNIGLKLQQVFGIFFVKYTRYLNIIFIY